MSQNDSPSNGKFSSSFAQTKDQLAESARRTAARVKEQAAEIAHQRKTGLADKIDSYRQSVDKTARDWEQDDPNLAWLTHEVSDRLGRASNYVRNTDFEQMHEDAAEVARSHPALFFGGLFLGGLVLGNLLKTGARTDTRAPRIAEPVPYPETEDVGPLRDESDTFPEAPASEMIK